MIFRFSILTILFYCLIILQSFGYSNLTTKKTTQDSLLKKTPQGIDYYILSDSDKNNNRQIKEGDFVRFNLMYLTDTDSLLKSTYIDGSPIETIIKIDNSQDKSQLMNNLLLLSKGDSAKFYIPSEKLFNFSNAEAHPKFLGPNRKLCYTIKIEDTKTMEELRLEKLNEENKRKIKEDSLITEYAKNKNLEFKKTESGLQYIITEKNRGKANLKTGDTVFVHYTGTLYDGTVFDTSISKGKPIRFPVNTRKVILGWDEGLMLMKKGEKATFAIPSHLAYGQRALGPIPANSILFFDIELVDVKPVK